MPVYAGRGERVRAVIVGGMGFQHALKENDQQQNGDADQTKEQLLVADNGA